MENEREQISQIDGSGTELSSSQNKLKKGENFLINKSSSKIRMRFNKFYLIEYFLKPDQEKFWENSEEKYLIEICTSKEKFLFPISTGKRHLFTEDNKLLDNNTGEEISSITDDNFPDDLTVINYFPSLIDLKLESPNNQTPSRQRLHPQEGITWERPGGSYLLEIETLKHEKFKFYVSKGKSYQFTEDYKLIETETGMEIAANSG